MKNLGIWTNDLDLLNLLRLRDRGFNSLFILTGYHYNQTGGEYEDRQKQTAELMYNTYSTAKKIGYKFFLIDFGWGLGDIDGIYFYKYIFEKFKNCTDIQFYFGEPFTGLRERFDDTTIKKILAERYILTNGNILFDETAKNFEELYSLYPINTTLSSFMNAGKYWSKGVSHVWIMGNPKIDFIGGAFCYKSLKKECDDLMIDTAFLYQGNVPAWTSAGWEAKIFSIFGLFNKFNESQQKRFIEIFSE